MLNLELQGQHIAIIKSPKYEKLLNNPVVSIGDARHGMKEIKLEADEEFQVIPNVRSERTIGYICGQSGSGKSYFCKDYCEQYKRINPKNDIFLLSALCDDKGSIDKVKGLKRIKLNDDFLNDTIDIAELKDSLIIFDDVDSLKGLQKKKVWELMNNVLTMGRHHNISCLITYHVITNGLDTKVILNESHFIVCFPSTMGNGAIKYLFDKYLGLDNKEIKKIKKIKTRWICVMKSYPKVIIAQKEMFIPSLMD
jgi:hypothetical protein